MANHHHINKELNSIFKTLNELNEKGLLSGLGIFVSYDNKSDSSKPTFFKVGNIPEIYILGEAQQIVENNFRRFSAQTADDLAS